MPLRHFAFRISPQVCHNLGASLFGHHYESAEGVPGSRQTVQGVTTMSTFSAMLIGFIVVCLGACYMRTIIHI